MLGITNRKFLVTANRGKIDCKEGQIKGFQIGAKRLQIGAGS